jgi:signal transduction histidine kinase
MTLTEHEASGAQEVPRGRRRAPDTLLENLQIIADGVVAMAGFAVAAIRIRRGDDLELVVDTDAPDAIGTSIPVQLMLDELALAEDWGLLQFVPHGVGDTSSGSWVVPRGVVVSDAPDAWHPMDMLVAPLYDAHGVLRGTLAIDEPLDGRLPDLERRRVLEKFAVLAARAVLATVERESLAEQVAMADTVKAIVRTTSAQLSLAGLLQASEHTLLDGFAAQRLWIKTVADDDQAVTDYLPGDLSLALPPDVVAFAESSATYCWRHQVVMKIGTDYPVPPKMTQHHFDQVVELLHSIQMSSMVFVPLGAGPECMGSLVLMRSDADREWTDIECAALLDIGHDLGRAALNARTFDREHALVKELQALDNYKSQLIATVSHELKSPLTTVAGHLEMLESGTITIGDQARASLAAIGRASDRMTRVIEDLLLLRKVGDARKPVRLDPVDLGELVRDAVALTALTAAEKELQIQVELRGHTVLALGEHDELDKVVHNLVSNAVKYTPATGSVQIRAESRGTESVLTIRDTGIGISAADQEHLFEEFFRSTNPAAVALPGTGLGLAIVRRIVERHGGRIELESAPGVGSTFRVSLPAPARAFENDRVPA